MRKRFLKIGIIAALAYLLVTILFEWYRHSVSSSFADFGLYERIYDSSLSSRKESFLLPLQDPGLIDRRLTKSVATATKIVHKDKLSCADLSDMFVHAGSSDTIIQRTKFPYDKYRIYGLSSGSESEAEADVMTALTRIQSPNFPNIVGKCTEATKFARFSVCSDVGTSIFDHFEAEQVLPNVVMTELMSGPSVAVLADVLSADSPLKWCHALNAAIQAIGTLEELRKLSYTLHDWSSLVYSPGEWRLVMNDFKSVKAESETFGAGADAVVAAIRHVIEPLVKKIELEMGGAASVSHVAKLIAKVKQTQENGHQRDLPTLRECRHALQRTWRLLDGDLCARVTIDVATFPAESYLVIPFSSKNGGPVSNADTISVREFVDAIAVPITPPIDTQLHGGLEHFLSIDVGDFPRAGVLPLSEDWASADEVFHFALTESQCKLTKSLWWFAENMRNKELRVVGANVIPRLRVAGDSQEGDAEADTDLTSVGQLVCGRGSPVIASNPQEVFNSLRMLDGVATSKKFTKVVIYGNLRTVAALYILPYLKDANSEVIVEDWRTCWCDLKPFYERTTADDAPWATLKRKAGWEKVYCDKMRSMEMPHTSYCLAKAESTRIGVNVIQGDAVNNVASRSYDPRVIEWHKNANDTFNILSAVWDHRKFDNAEHDADTNAAWRALLMRKASVAPAVSEMVIQVHVLVACEYYRQYANSTDKKYEAHLRYQFGNMSIVQRQVLRDGHTLVTLAESVQCVSDWAYNMGYRKNKKYCELTLRCKLPADWIEEEENGDFSHALLVINSSHGLGNDTVPLESVVHFPRLQPIVNPPLPVTPERNRVGLVMFKKYSWIEDDEIWIRYHLDVVKVDHIVFYLNTEKADVPHIRSRLALLGLVHNVTLIVNHYQYAYEKVPHGAWQCELTVQDSLVRFQADFDYIFGIDTDEYVTLATDHDLLFPETAKVGTRTFPEWLAEPSRRDQLDKCMQFVFPRINIKRPQSNPRVADAANVRALLSGLNNVTVRQLDKILGVQKKSDLAVKSMFSVQGALRAYLHGLRAHPKACPNQAPRRSPRGGLILHLRNGFGRNTSLELIKAMKTYSTTRKYPASSDQYKPLWDLGVALQHRPSIFNKTSPRKPSVMLGKQKHNVSIGRRRNTTADHEEMRRVLAKDINSGGRA